MASGIKLIKALHLHRQFLKISHRLLRLWRNPNFVWEPPPCGEKIGFGFLNPLEFLGGNGIPSRALCARRGQFFVKFTYVVIIPKSSDSFQAESELNAPPASAKATAGTPRQNFLYDFGFGAQQIFSFLLNGKENFASVFRPQGFGRAGLARGQKISSPKTPPFFARSPKLCFLEFYDILE